MLCPLPAPWSLFLVQPNPYILTGLSSLWIPNAPLKNQMYHGGDVAPSLWGYSTILTTVDPPRQSTPYMGVPPSTPQYIYIASWIWFKISTWTDLGVWPVLYTWCEIHHHTMYTPSFCYHQQSIASVSTWARNHHNLDTSTDMWLTKTSFYGDTSTHCQGYFYWIWLFCVHALVIAPIGVL